jgi:hypothetical protein
VCDTNPVYRGAEHVLIVYTYLVTDFGIPADLGKLVWSLIVSGLSQLRGSRLNVYVTGRSLVQWLYSTYGSKVGVRLFRNQSSVLIVL